AISKCHQYAECVRRVALVLGLHVAAVAQQPGIPITLNRRFAQHLGQPSLPGSLPHLHLEQAILRSNESLREEEIMLVDSIDVRHSPVVALDLHSRIQTLDFDLAVDWRHCLLSPRGKIATLLTIDGRRNCQAKQKDKGASHFKARLYGF